jgi:hypothetical protein
MKQSANKQGTHQVYMKLDGFDMGAICHMANIKVEFQVLASLCTGCQASQLQQQLGYVSLVLEGFLTEENSKLHLSHISAGSNSVGHIRRSGRPGYQSTFTQSTCQAGFIKLVTDFQMPVFWSTILLKQRFCCEISDSCGIN